MDEHKSMRKKNTLYLEDLLPYVQETEEYLLEENINEMFHYNDFVKSIGTKENITFDEEKGPKKLEKKPYKPVLTRKLITGNEGYCKVCDKWFKLKNSSNWYHMNFIHGINSVADYLSQFPNKSSISSIETAKTYDDDLIETDIKNIH
ncbi:meiotic expression up-regulated 26 protein [Tubulinosema ratisbonensis]|uniref:Meiotic expression up-regulated 26 protein n=1 Tax=Tubulinosema ratisbonensis TaxID=291195 RepID=A0A437AJ85_9MICR|nr:meiotic expression up-regulated 26 protein [Tubulinosema ratisbonensis]